MIPDPAIPWDDDVEVQEEVSLQVEAASGEEDSNKVTESAMPISKGCSSIYATRMQEQNPEERKWNQIHSAWSDYAHSEEIQNQYRQIIISVADILSCMNRIRRYMVVCTSMY